MLYVVKREPNLCPHNLHKLSLHTTCIDLSQGIMAEWLRDGSVGDRESVGILRQVVMECLPGLNWMPRGDKLDNLVAGLRTQ